MNCTSCQSERTVKSGFILDKQRFKCKECGYHFTSHSPRTAVSLKRMAIHLYLEGLSYKKISQVIEVSDVAIARWIHPLQDSLKKYRKESMTIKPLHKIEHFLITRNMFNDFGWLILGFDSNNDINLIGSQETGNCKIERK